MERIRRDVYNLLTVLFVGAIVAAGSIVVFRTTLPQDLPLSEDGFYEIYTAYDYERFWRKGISIRIPQDRKKRPDTCLKLCFSIWFRLP